MSKTPHYLIVLNPMDSRPKRQKLARLQQELERRNWPYQLFYTRRDWQQTRLALKPMLKNVTDVVVLGGDGTLNMAVNGLVGHQVNIGLVPCGTGNDFSKNIYKKGDDAIAVALSQKLLPMDLGCCNGRYFINVLGIGFDGELVERINEHPVSIFRPLVYLWQALRTIPFYKEKHTEVISGQRQYSGKSLIAAFGNGRYFGNGMQITPKATLNDGLLDCCWVGQTHLLKKCYYLSKIFTGKHLRTDIVQYWQDTVFEVPTPGCPIEGDGEFFGHSPAQISVVPSAITIKVA